MKQAIKVAFLNPLDKTKDFEMIVNKQTKVSFLLCKVMAMMGLRGDYCFRYISNNMATSVLNNDKRIKEYVLAKKINLFVTKAGAIGSKELGGIATAARRYCIRRSSKKQPGSTANKNTTLKKSKPKYSRFPPSKTTRISRRPLFQLGLVDGFKKEIKFEKSTFAVLSATAVSTAVLSQPIYAEAGKKAIYDDHEPVVQRPKATEPPPRIVAFARNAREDVAMFSSMIKMHGQALVDRWIATEKQIVQVVERTVPQGERLAPGIVYVGVAALAGPIFTRRRNFAIRWTSPFVFASLASFYFLPGTANVVLRNIWGRYGDPKTIDNIRDRWQSVKRAEREFRDGLADSIQELRLSLQEGRKFSSDSKNHHGVKETVASIAAPVVEETREIAETVSGMAAAATENIKSGISSSSTYNRVREVSNDIVHPMKSAELTGKKEEKKQLPLGFKEKTD
ncbi:hypothetical protein EDC05_001846 [Coemansia umbellata]|uniref:MICOS complex subunit n=1 Tax=Coemansia umbellata TaxID=1424467 RepID=A0ABQ8PQG1_9FUNG|nr:hypothetical protein EDC05_001846 [Coemansia umbellata]